MKRRLLISGAGGFGRELESWLSAVPESNRDWELGGYLDNEYGQDTSWFGQYPSKLRIIGHPDDFPFLPDDLCVISPGFPKQRRALFDNLRERVEIFTFIHPSAVIGLATDIGSGSIVCPGCILSTNVKLGAGVMMNVGSFIGHDAKVGDFTCINGGVYLGGKSSIGDDVYIGQMASVIPGVSIADNILIGTASVVTKALKKRGSYFGNPAQLFWE